MITVAKLRSFDEARFYSLLDVALDIRGELDFRVHPIRIELMRHLVRYQELLPAATPSLCDRYCDLRLKAALFLQTEGYLRHVEVIDTYGLSHTENLIQLDVSDSAGFYELVVMLTTEEERRSPGSTADDLPSAMVRMEQLGNSFHRSALAMKHARSGSSFAIDNEYDVQTLMHGLLTTRFDDIRPEEWTPSYAGKASRTDFLLKPEQLVVETKMTRDGLNDAELGNQLIIDTDRYKQHPDCRALFCFVYDPSHRLKNPTALESDLSRKTDGLIVRVQIRPKR